MENLKIRVNSEAESREVQELFFSLGGSWAGHKNVETWADIGHLYLENGCISFGSDTEYFEKCKESKEVTLSELWALADQGQDEPFLTPECTLNDQYAEIEQVRQQTIEATLAERQSTYGNFEDVAFVTENIMSVLAKVRPNGLQDLPNAHRMALYMIASKMARIVNGDFNHLDSWHDIGGYAKLIEKLIKGE